MSEATDSLCREVPHVLCSVLAFDDDSIAVQVLHRGSLESCKEAADFVDALSYNGPKRVIESCVRWMPEEAYIAARAGDIDKARAIEDGAG